MQEPVSMKLLSKGLLLFALVTAVAFDAASQGQDISGTWQGTLDGRGAKLRLVLNIGKAVDGWEGTLLSIDQSPDWGAAARVQSISLQGETVKVKINDTADFEGTLDRDGLTL